MKRRYEWRGNRYVELTYDGKVIEGWFKANGASIPIVEGQTQEEALEEFHKKHMKKERISVREYAVLRQEVFRKNAAQKGKVKPFNSAFTADNFYFYYTTGGENFTPLMRLDIEKDSALISWFLKRI